MRTHKEIVHEAKPETISGQLNVSINTVRSWRVRDSIPSEHWASLIKLGHATAEELIAGAAKAAA